MNNDFVRRSPDASENKQIRNTERKGKDGPRGNRAWLDQQEVRSGVLLLGGVSVDHFRIRVAQSRYRDDLAPSFWSMAGILTADGKVHTVPIDRLPNASMVPTSNAIHEFDFATFASAEAFPNIAVLSFSKELDEVVKAADRIRKSRAVLDLPSTLITWLSYVWATDAGSNPLRQGVGVPSAAFVETAYAACGIEISPGQRTASSSPEAIWQAARWWSKFYEAAAKHDRKTVRPSGAYCVRQWAAAALGIRDNMEGDTILPAAQKQSRPGKRPR